MIWRQSDWAKMVDTTGLEPVNLNNVDVALYQLSYASFFVK
jgi:hypothetical protein